MPTTCNLVTESLFCVGVGDGWWHAAAVEQQEWVVARLKHIIVTETFPIKILQLLHKTELIFPSVGAYSANERRRQKSHAHLICEKNCLLHRSTVHTHSNILQSAQFAQVLESFECLFGLGSTRIYFYI